MKQAGLKISGHGTASLKRAIDELVKKCNRKCWYRIEEVRHKHG